MTPGLVGAAVSAAPATADPPDFDEQFRTLSGPMFRLAYALCGDRSVAEEAVADAFAAVIARSRRTEIHDPAAYMRRAVVNRVRSAQRRRSVRDRFTRIARIGNGDVASCEDAVAQRESVVRALADLSPRQREIVVLRYLEDVSEKETAELLHISVGSVKAHTSRAVAQLRFSLGKEGDQ